MRVNIDKAGEIGLVVDLDRHEIPHNAWTSVSNVRFDLGAAKACYGYEELTTPTAEALYLLRVDASGVAYLLYPTADAVYSYAGGVETDISRATAYSTTTKWNGCVLNGVAVLNSYENCPQYWGGTGDCVDLPYSGANTWDDADGAGSNYRARVIRAYRNFLFALGINDDGDDYPYMVHWSSPADPGTVPSSWDYTDPTELSGRFDLADSPGHVVDALPLRDSLIIYKEDAVWIATYVGGQYQFRFDKLADAGGMGIYGQNCAVDIGGKHAVLGDGVFYIHDGNSVQDVLKGRAASVLFDQIDPDSYSRTFLLHDSSEKEVWVCYPPVGETKCKRAYVYNYSNGTWSWKTLPSMNFATTAIVSGDVQSWPADTVGGGWEDDLAASWDTRNYSPVADTVIGVGAKIYEFTSRTGQFDGANPTVKLERTGLRFGQGGQVALITAIYPRVVGGSVKVRVGKQLTLSGAVSWNAEQTFNPGTMTKIDCTVSGQYHAIRFRSTNGALWSLSGYEVELESVGLY